LQRSGWWEQPPARSSGAFIWILLTEPTTMAAALETGDVRLLIAALTGAAH
jgi:hypothetical protein